MSRPLVSVVVAVKNGEAYLREALGSVIAQRHRPLEVIVVDGRSTDRTLEIARSFDVVHVVEQAGIGIADAYNTGIACARGEYTAFLSSDDVWTAEKLDVQMTFMRTHPEVRFTVGKARFLLQPGVPVPAGFRTELLEGTHTASIMETLVTHRSVWTEVGGFDTALALAHDVDWFSRARHLGVPMAVLPDVLLEKRIHGANASLDVARNNPELLKVVRRSIRRQRLAVVQPPGGIAPSRASDVRGES